MGNEYKIDLSNDKSLNITIDGVNISVNGSSFHPNVIKTGKQEWNIIQNNQSYTIALLDFDAKTKKVSLEINGKTYAFEVKDKLDLMLGEMGMSRGGQTKMIDVKAPMPGLVLEVMVENGQAIAEGDALLILEAMKMENVIKADGDGVIKNILVKNQDTVEKNQILIEME